MGADTGNDLLGWDRVRTERITLRQAIEMALKNNINIRWSKTDVKVDADRVRIAWGAFDPSLNLTATRESIRTPQDAQQIVATGQGESLLQLQQNRLLAELIYQQAVTQAILSGQAIPPRPAALDEPIATTLNQTPIFEEENYRLQSAVQGRMPWGGQYSLGLRADQLDNTLSRQIPPSLFNPEWATFAGVSFNQPLLRDFGFDANLAEVRIARKNREISEITWESKIVTAMTTVLVTYYDMLFSYRLIDVWKDAIEADRKLLGENRRRLDLGMMAPIDVQQAEAQMSVDEDKMLVAKNLFMERQFQLKRQVLKGYEAEVDQVYCPTGDELLEAPRINRAELMKIAFEYRLDYRNALKDADIQNIRLKYAKNQLWPRLDVVATLGYNGLSNSLDSSWSKALDSQAPQWSIGLQASIPLGNLQARAQYDVVKGLKEQAVLRIKQVELNISLDVDTAISRVVTNTQSMETSRKTVRLREEEVRIQKRRIEEGQISSFEAIETLKKLYDERSRELNAVAELNKSIIQLWAATGTVLQRLSIRVEK